MKKAIVSTLLVVAFMLPSYSFAQSTSEEEFRSYLIQLISLLQQQIAILLEQKAEISEQGKKITQIESNTRKQEEKVGSVSAPTEHTVSVYVSNGSLNDYVAEEIDRKWGSDPSIGAITVQVQKLKASDEVKVVVRNSNQELDGSGSGRKTDANGNDHILQVYWPEKPLSSTEVSAELQSYKGKKSPYEVQVIVNGKEKTIPFYYDIKQDNGRTKYYLVLVPSGGQFDWKVSDKN